MGLLPMEADILPPSDDRVFKLILTSPEAKQALMNLISCVIGRTVVDVVLLPNELAPGDTEEKAERFDVNCKIDDGSQVNLEMQASYMVEDLDGQHRNLKGKSVYYLTDLHSSQPAKGLRRYDRLARSYQITFCSYTIFPNTQDYVNSFSMRHNVTGELLSDAISVTFVELSKLDEVVKKPVSDMTALDIPQIFLRTPAVKSDPQIRPGILLVRLIENLRSRFNQETLSCLQVVPFPAGPVMPLSFQDIMNQVVGPHRRPEAVQRLAFGITAVAQIQIGKFPVG